jgi:uncharacterized protein YqhQ
MASEKIRLGGMALQNGVLVHGPTAWAAAVRTPSGEVKVAAAKKRVLAGWLDRPVLAAMAASAVAVRLVRGSPLRPAATELASGLLSFAPAAFALRGSDLAAYHGAEHVSIGSYEHGEVRAKEHERCGSHLLGPFIATSTLGGFLASRVPHSVRGPARAAASLGALAVATELFGWMVRNPERPLAKALARPGHELQHRLATAEPSAAQLEVAEAALAACLELEQ